MKAVVIGGTGAFGAKVCDLLARDGHAVTVATRNVGETGGASHLVFDRNGPLDGLHGFDVIVDAAGPFHTYGDDPYRIAKAAIATGAHYFDLSDNADFCQGIAILNKSAEDAGVAVVSGMSSVPAVSSSAVSALCGDQTPLMIDSAILPANKAPRGRNVVESILAQTGLDYQETQAGQKIDVRSWSDPHHYQIGDQRRQAWRIEVPDQRLFPDHFNCPNVTFRAGLELGVMRYGLAALSWLRGRFGFGMPRWLVSLMLGAAKILAPLGTDTGGMVVRARVPDGDGFTDKTWTMLAKTGDGPFTPAIAVRAACRDLSALPVGAYPALSVVSLDAIEACFADLNITTSVSQLPYTPPFRKVLGDAFDTLEEAVRATHDAAAPRRFSGKATVTRGTGIQARLAALVFGFPPSGEDVPVTVTKIPTSRGETWVRQFGRSVFKSHLSATDRGMCERFGIFAFDLDLTVKDGALMFPVRSGHVLGLPLPRFLLPESQALEAVGEDGRFQFDVQLKAPTGATLVHYRGWLASQGPTTP